MICRVAISVGFRQFWEGSQKSGVWGNSEKEGIRKWWQQQCPAHDTNRIFATKIVYLEISHDNIIIIGYSSWFDDVLYLYPGGSDSKASAWSAGDPGSTPGLGRSPGEGNGNPLQYSCLENSMDWGAWKATVHGVAKSWTRLSNITGHRYTSIGASLIVQLVKNLPVMQETPVRFLGREDVL